MRRAAIVVALLAAGCLRYAPVDPGGIGYSDTPLSPEIYDVRFRAPANLFAPLRGEDPAARDRDLALLRAAQVTLTEGYAYFVIDPVWIEPPPATGGVRYVIRVFRQRPPLDAEVVYDAAAIQRELLEDYPSIGAQAVPRAPEPRWSEASRTGVSTAPPQEPAAEAP